MRFREIQSGGRFRYQGRIYFKGRLNFAKDVQKQKSFLFPSETEVCPINEAGCVATARHSGPEPR